MWHAWGIGKVHTGFWQGDLRERDHWENLGVDGRIILKCIFEKYTSLVVQWSESLTANHEVPGWIHGSTVGIFLEEEDSRGYHGLGRLVEFRFKAPPGTTSSSITTHTSLGLRNCASWASQPQQSFTLLPCPGGRTTKSTKGHAVALEKKTAKGDNASCVSNFKE